MRSMDAVVIFRVIFPCSRPYLTADVLGLYVSVACQATLLPSPTTADGMPDAYRSFREKPQWLSPAVQIEEVFL